MYWRFNGTGGRWGGRGQGKGSVSAEGKLKGKREGIGWGKRGGGDFKLAYPIHAPLCYSRDGGKRFQGGA